MKNNSRTSGVSTALKKIYLDQTNSHSSKDIALYHIEVANTLEKRKEVFEMVYHAYLEKGFITENANKWHVIPQDISPDTLILLVRDQFGIIAGTVSIIFDQSVNLPATKIYSEEINYLRKSGANIAEVSRLAISKKHRHSKEILSLLFNHLAIYCSYVKKVTSLICEVNPRHLGYYQSIFAFEQIGSLKPCPMVQENPAVLLHLTIQKCNGLLNIYNESSKFKALYSTKEAINIASNLTRNRKPISEKEQHYFNFIQNSAVNLTN